MGVGALLLLAKVNFVWQIVEKAIYAGIGIVGVVTTVRYIKDYKESVEEEKYVKR